MIAIADRPTLHALLIGIDAYPQPSGETPGTSIPSLRGCVRDVVRMRDHLAAAGVPSRRIACLAPSADADGSPPTRQALIDALLALLDRAQKGEQVLVHYSGHGTRLATAFGEEKWDGSGYDEALVPCDAPARDAALLRDVEIAYLLKRFVDREVFVTLVLDCCHAGGAAMRDGDGFTSVRTVRALDGAERPLGDGLASYDELIAAWRWWGRPAQRDWRPNWGTGDSGWLPLPRGYTLIAACTHSEEAQEIETAEGGYTGLLTDRLLQVLEAASGELTYKQLYERLQAAFAACAGDGDKQHPQIEGEVDRVLFGGALRPTTWALRVLSCDGRLVQLDGGRAHGLRPGARVRVRPPVEEQTRGGEVTAVLTEVGAVRSSAEIEVDRATAWVPAVAAGAEVVVDDPGDPSLALAVELRFDGLDERQQRALAAVDREAKKQENAFLRAAGVGEAEVVVAVADGRFTVVDAAGQPLAMDPLRADPAEAPRLVDRLVHVAKYRNVERLRNDYGWSALAGRVEMELGLLPDDFDPRYHRPEPEPLPRGDDGVYRVRVGRWVCLTIRNRSRGPLELALFDLRPDWSVKQLLPSPGGGGSRVLEGSPHEPPPLHLPMSPDLPAGIDAGRDLLKLFAATRPTRFNWLTLPPLGDTHRDAPPPPTSALEELMARWGAEPHRDFQLGIASGDEWTTVQVESWMTRE